MQWIFRSIYIVILFLFCMVWMLRFLKEAGFFCAKGKVFSYLTAQIPVEKKRKGNSAWNKADAKKIFAYSFLFRLLMFGIGVFLYFVVLREQTNPDVFSMGNTLSIWEKWDATHYINLAKEGYAQYTENGEHLFLRAVNLAANQLPTKIQLKNSLKAHNRKGGQGAKRQRKKSTKGTHHKTT